MAETLRGDAGDIEKNSDAKVVWKKLWSMGVFSWLNSDDRDVYSSNFDLGDMIV